MKFRPVRLGLARSLVALSVSLAVVLSTHAFAFSTFSSHAQTTQPDAPQSEFRLVAVSATTTSTGILIQWRTNAAADNLGFNIYRVKDGQRTRINRGIIPGAAFVSPRAQALMLGGYSYSWFDRGGSADSTYYIESVSLQGAGKTHEAVSPSKTVSRFEQTPETLAGAGANAAESNNSFEKFYPAAESQTNSTTGPLQDQWAIAAQSGVKIGIKKDGWYRVTKAQVAAVGFNPTVDIRNLQLYTEAQEVAINTSQQTGPFGASDYIEFYGRGLDTPTTDTRIYYLIAGTTPGKRVLGQNQLDDIIPPPPTPTPVSSPPTPQPTPEATPQPTLQPTPQPTTQPTPQSTPSPTPQATPQPTPQPAPTPPASSGPVLRAPVFQSSIDPNAFIAILLGSTGKNETRERDFTRLVNPQSDLARPYSSAGDKSPVENFQPDISPPRNARAVVSAAAKPEGQPAGRKPQDQAVESRTQNTVGAGATIKGAAKVKTRSRRVSRRHGKLRQRAHAKRRKTSTPPRNVKLERHHAPFTIAAAASTPANFQYTAERKDRTNYYSALLNGDGENYFGHVVAVSAYSETITTPNPDLTAAGPAKLEVAMQGVTQVFHQVDVKFNGLSLGMVQPSNFFGQSHVVATFDVPISLLQNGVNTLTFTPQACSPTCDTTLIDYTRVTYPHQFLAELAPGSIHLISQPNVDDTLMVGGKTYTFRISPTTNLHIGIGVDRSATATNIATRINSDTAFTLCGAIASSTDVVLTANNPGQSNSIALTVDGVRLTKTDLPKSLRFSLRGTQSASIDGFATPSVRLIDYTDPLAVSISRPSSGSSALGFAIAVPTSDPPSKPPRLLYAIPDGQFDQPASISLNQTSSLNLNSNEGDFLIISHKDFVASVEPLRVARASQFPAAKVIDVEDIYDEFSYGAHGPQAIKDFLALASTLWTTKPRYVVFTGDASYDPRNYSGAGNFDFLPSKLLDATYSETVSDDWFTDFDSDGVGDIPVGRIPVRTAADATVVVTKIINFTPVTPESAMLVADDPGTPPFWDFESGSDNVEALLPPSMAVQKSYRRLESKVLTGTISADSASLTVTGTGTLFTTEIQPGDRIAKDSGEPLGTVDSVTNATSLTLKANATTTYIGNYGKQDDSTAHARIVAGFNQGRAVVNYSGHGNVNVWTGGGIFTSADASALTNLNTGLPFVIVMDCLNGLFQDPFVLSLSEAFLKNPNGGAVAAFASSGLTGTYGQRQMELELYAQLYGGQSIALGDAIKIAKTASSDPDVRTTWIYFGDPSIKIR